MKPIEEGCLAVIINSFDENNGMLVIVGKFIGKITHCKENKIWDINKPITVFQNHETPPCFMQMKAAPESCLLRIDGYEGEQEINKESLTIKA